MRVLDKWEEIFIAISILVATILVFVNVVMRTAGSGTTWSEELIRYLLIWVTFIGISVCVRQGVHVTIDLVPNLLKGKGRLLVMLIIYVLAILFSCALAWYGMEFVAFSQSTSQKAPSLNIPMYLVYLVIPLSGLLMLLRYLQKIIDLFRAGLQPVGFVDPSASANPPVSEKSRDSAAQPTAANPRGSAVQPTAGNPRGSAAQPTSSNSRSSAVTPASAKPSSPGRSDTP